MFKLKALLLTQGMHGMISQVEGLAKALNLNFSHHTVKLKGFWNYIPPKFTPISENLLTEKLVFDSRVIISCGRKSVVPSIALKKRYKNQVFNIHIQDPKVSLSNFDAIVCPEHDDLNGPNVIKTKGSIHYLTLDEIKKNSSYLKIQKEDKKIVAFIIGGPNKYYNFSESYVDKMFNQIKTLFMPDKYKLIVIPSYRTPEEIIKKAHNTFSHNHLVIKKIDKKAYLSSLDLADIIVVTCDSTSMISEAAITSKPIYIANMKAKRNNYRFQNFYSKFKEMKIIRDLDTYQDGIDLWTYNKLDETQRIVPLIKGRMKNNGII
tara:strand:+ start:48 stop:1007 length:960 start_codon:yes stop_codon:yes gene_type:complete